MLNASGNFRLYKPSGSPPPPPSSDLIVRARGVAGSEQLRIDAAGETLAYLNLNQSMQDYAVSGYAGGEVTVNFVNDASGLDVQVDRVVAQGVTYEAEDQSSNTAVWQGQCGGSFSEMMHCGGTITFPIASSSEVDVVVRARGVSGGEQIELWVDGVTVGSYSLGTTMDSYIYSGYAGGVIDVVFVNDVSGYDVQVDYIAVDGLTVQAEDQSDNSGVWQGQCGGSYSEWLHCAGSINFGSF